MNIQQQKNAHPQVAEKHPPGLERELRQALKAANCFASTGWHHCMHILAVVILFGSSYTLLLTQPHPLLRFAALLMLAFCSVQAGYIAHEAGHGAITRKRWLKNSIGQFFNTFLTALSYAHFQKIHTCHHTHCNNQDLDIDMQSAFFSLYPDAKQSNNSLLGRFITRHQAYLIWPLVSLQGFSLKIDSLKTLWRNPQETRVDQLVLILHFLLWFGLPVHLLGLGDATLNYFLLTWFIGPYLGSVFLVNHIGTEVTHSGDKTPRFQQRLITTRNLGESRAADLFFGGMNHHIEHHLFPSIPAARLRRARPIVEAFCNQHGLSYRKTRWRDALVEVFHYLNQIAHQPEISKSAFSIGGTDHESR